MPSGEEALRRGAGVQAHRGSNQVDAAVVRVRVMEGRGVKIWVREVGAEMRGTEALRPRWDLDDDRA